MTARAILLLGCQRGLLGALAALLCLVTTVSRAAEPRIERIEPLITDGQMTLDLDLTFELGRVVIEAAERGVPLYFTFDLKITSPRWWWFDRVLVEANIGTVFASERFGLAHDNRAIDVLLLHCLAGLCGLDRDDDSVTDAGVPALGAAENLEDTADGSAGIICNGNDGAVL